MRHWPFLVVSAVTVLLASSEVLATSQRPLLTLSTSQTQGEGQWLRGWDNYSSFALLERAKTDLTFLPSSLPPSSPRQLPTRLPRPARVVQ